MCEGRSSIILNQDLSERGAGTSPEGLDAVNGSLGAGRRTTKAGQLGPIHPHPTESHSNVCSMPGKKPEAF